MAAATALDRRVTIEHLMSFVQGPTRQDTISFALQLVKNLVPASRDEVKIVAPHFLVVAVARSKRNNEELEALEELITICLDELGLDVDHVFERQTLLSL